MTIGTRDQFKRALARAAELRGWERVRDLGEGRYAVTGRHGAYVVTLDADGEYACTCPAGRHDGACWHQASVYLARAQRAAFRPLATAATAAPLAIAPTVDPITRRPSGRGIGFEGDDFRYGDDEPVTLGEILAELGPRPAWNLPA